MFGQVSTIVSLVALKEVAHEVVCLSESHLGLNFVMSVVHYAIVIIKLNVFFKSLMSSVVIFT